MFAEELGSNASRKRAEEAKERRKRLKEKQLAAEKQKTKANAANAASAVTAASLVAAVSPETGVQQQSAVVGTAVTLSIQLSATSVTPLVQTNPTSTPKPMSAVERAAEQRQLRATQLAQQHAIVKVQMVIRLFLCRRKLRSQFVRELEQKLSDIVTLRRILLKKTVSKGTCISPAMTTVLVRQFLFVAATTPCTMQSTVPLLGQLLELVVLPGFLETEEKNLNHPLAMWIESSTGLYRLRQFLGSLLFHYYHSNAKQQQNSCIAIVQCLRALLLGSTRLQMQCRTYLLQLPPKKEGENTVALVANSENSLDLIASLRCHLLLMRDKPIPSDAEVKRDACFTTVEKDRYGALVQLVFDAVLQEDTSNSRQLRARFVKEFMTIPLLSWRVSAATLSRLASPASQPLLITLLQAFTEEFVVPLNNGKIEALLESSDLPMTRCGATGTQRLLANVLQLGRLIPACNGTVTTKRDFAVAASFFQVVASLVDAVPLCTFLSSCESAIAWMSVDGNHKAIVLSPIILEQCKALLVEKYVRRLFQSAIDTTCLQTDSILATKNEKDLDHEKELNETGNSSAATLASKEARVDRNQGFWNSSKWAQKLAKGVTSLISSDPTSIRVSKKNGQGTGDAVEENMLNAIAAGSLQDTSFLSRQLAEGDKRSSSVSAAELKQERRSNEYSTDLLLAISRTYSILVARWGGGGNDDVVPGSSSKNRGSRGVMQSATSTSSPEAWLQSLLNVLCFSTPIVRVAWGLIQSDDAIIADVDSIIDAARGKTPVRSLSIQPKFVSSLQQEVRRKDSRINNNYDGVPLFYLFLCALSHVLIITDDSEIHDTDRPLPIHQIRRCIQVLKKLLYRATCIDRSKIEESPVSLLPHFAPNYFGLALISASSRTMRDLYDRSSRRPICVPNLWIVPSLMEKEISQCKKYEDYQSLVSTSPVLRVCPYMVSFKRRLKLFERIITANRVEIQGENSSNPFHTNPLKPGIPVRISRSRLLEDGLSTMNNLGSNMRQRIAVQYYNEAGARESGIDAGGLFKEFWTDLCAISFDPNYALFRVTDSGTDAGVGNCLYPNPSSAAAHGTDHVVLFAFLGRILGKALYEGITIHPKFAHFFLSFLKGDYNFLHMLPDLSTVDSQLYRNLMFLKTYDGDASDLCLTFTVTVDDFGGTNEIPLVPNGAHVDVTESNKQLYVGLVAKYYVYDRIREQSEAMTRGLFEVIDRSWLRIFNEPELQVLVSGSSDGKLDVDDMKANCQYAGGYSSIDRTVSKFWKVVASLNEKQQAALLRFITSCERPPPLGFGSMNPPLTIQRVGILRDGDRLPTASTCFNILKLPTYSCEKVLRERLLYAIESGAGFELS